MDPSHLVQLAVILEKGSITQATRHLHLTQPTLTRNMRALEAQAGGSLFTRSRFGVRSTILREMLAREGRAIAGRMQDAFEVVARHKLGLRSQIRLGAGPLIGAAIGPELIERLVLQHPGVTLTVQSDRPHLLVDQLIDGRHDLVIAPSWLERPPEGIERFLLVPDTIGVFCGRSHRLAGAPSLDGGAAGGETWIGLGAASPFDRDVREMLSRAGIHQPRTEIVVLGEALMLLRTLSKGKHLSVLPRFPVRLLQNDFGLVELALKGAPQPRTLYLWCHTTSLQDPVFTSVRQTILDYAATLSATVASAREE